MPAASGMVDWVLILLLSMPAGQVPVSAGQAPSAGSRDVTAKARTATVRGRVTDRDTGQPLGRVTVSLISTVWRDQAMSSSALAQMGGVDDPRANPNEPRYTLTAADGRFEFKEVLPGAYHVAFSANSRGTHLDQTFGESAPRDPFKPGKRAPPIQLRDGETRDNVDIALWRGFAVDGRVVDDAGEPVANVEVIISPWESPPTMTLGRSRVTDDRGMFRVFGLRPGQYRICADGGLNFASSYEVRDKLIRTCYPGAVRDVDAHPVVVSSAEAGPIEIRLQRNRTYRITGMAVDSSGAPILSPDVNVVSITPTGSSSSSSGVQVKRDGQFIASGVAPGDYAIHVGTGWWRFRNPEERGNRETGYAEVRVDTADIDGLVVTTSKPAKVSGRIVFEGGAPDQNISKLSVTAWLDNSTERGRMMFGPPPAAAVRDDLSFELDGLSGPQLLMVTGPPRGWIVKSVKYLGADVTETFVEFKSSSDPRLLEITLTNQGASVTGRVLDDDGKESTEGYVVMLPADVSRWRQFPGTPAIPPRSDGTFTFGPVRPGEYVIAAVTGVSMASLFDPSARAEIAARIIKVAERIVLAENDKRSIDLRITKLQ